MKGASLLSCAFLASSASAIKLSAKARRSNVGITVAGVVRQHPTTLFTGSAGDDEDEIEVNNRGDLAYSTVIKLGGQEYGVQMDTGSSDLWVYSPKTPIPTVNTTTIPAGVTYGKGSIEGKIDFAELEFGDYKVPSQAFINVEHAVDMEGTFAEGNSGLLGLSFDSSSSVDAQIRDAFGSSSTAGRTPISNIFYQHPELPNFISVLLGRTGDLDDEVEGVFTISEYIEEFKAVQQEPKIPRQTVNTERAISRWNAEIEGISVNGHSIPLKSSLPGVKAGTAIGMLDTGYSFPPVPVYIADAIYSSIPGSLKVDGSEIWVVPCMNTTSLSFHIGGKEFPIHHLDLTYVNRIKGPQGHEYTYCTNTFKGEDVAKKFGDMDMILGDSFLKNMYAVFDWGSESDGGSEAPFMQLLSTTTMEEATPEFERVRAESLKGMPPELSPTDLLTLTGENGSHSSAGTSGRNGDQPGVNLAESEGATSQFEEILDKVGGYGPIIIGLLAGNMLFLIILTIIGLAICIRRGGKSRAAPAYVPVKLKDTEAHPAHGTSYNTPYNNTGYHD